MFFYLSKLFMLIGQPSSIVPQSGAWSKKFNWPANQLPLSGGRERGSGYFRRARR